jgi:Fe-S-cluster containining protein
MDRLELFRADLEAPERALLETQRRASTQVLGQGEHSERVFSAAREALERGETRRLHHLSVAQPIACREGCHWCCHLQVTATAAEVCLIAERLRRDADPQVLERIRARLPLKANASDDTTVSCGLLTEAGSCGVYEVRPLACRGWTSRDAESCERSLHDEAEPPPTDLQLARECGAIGLGLVDALRSSGFSAGLVELNAALLIALDEPRALERWHAGEAVFDPALVDRDEPK